MNMREKATVGALLLFQKDKSAMLFFCRILLNKQLEGRPCIKIFFVLLVGAKWFLASRLWRLINQMNGGGGDLSQLKLSLRFRSRLSRNSIKRPAPHILGIRCSLNRNPNHVKMPSVLMPHIRHKNERRY